MRSFKRRIFGGFNRVNLISWWGQVFFWVSFQGWHLFKCKIIFCLLYSLWPPPFIFMIMDFLLIIFIKLFNIKLNYFFVIYVRWWICIRLYIAFALPLIILLILLILFIFYYGVIARQIFFKFFFDIWNPILKVWPWFKTIVLFCCFWA